MSYKFLNRRVLLQLEFSVFRFPGEKPVEEMWGLSGRGCALRDEGDLVLYNENIQIVNLNAASSCPRTHTHTRTRSHKAP